MRQFYLDYRDRWSDFELEFLTPAQLVLTRWNEPDTRLYRSGGIGMKVRRHWDAEKRQKSIAWARREHEAMVKAFGASHAPPFDYKEIGDFSLSIMPWFSGVRLNDIPRADWPMLKVFAAILQVNRRGVVHRDINPGNLIVDEETGVVTLIDFGSAQPCSPLRAVARDMLGWGGSGHERQLTYRSLLRKYLSATLQSPTLAWLRRRPRSGRPIRAAVAGGVPSPWTVSSGGESIPGIEELRLAWKRAGEHGTPFFAFNFARVGFRGACKLWPFWEQLRRVVRLEGAHVMEIGSAPAIMTAFALLENASRGEAWTQDADIDDANGHVARAFEVGLSSHRGDLEQAPVSHCDLLLLTGENAADNCTALLRARIFPRKWLAVIVRSRDVEGICREAKVASLTPEIYCANTNRSTLVLIRAGGELSERRILDERHDDSFP